MKNVLIAADPDSVASLLRHCLKPEPRFQILAASAVPQMLDRFVRFNGGIELLVIDTALDPAVSSIDVALNFRFYFPGLRIVFLFDGSSLLCTRQQRIAIDALPTGAVTGLRKPYSPQILRLRIEALLSPALRKVA